MRAWLLAGALLLPSIAVAHRTPPTDRAIVQIRPDATEILYELSIPPGPDAGRWRLLADVDRNGVLTAAEMQGLAKLLATRVAARLKLQLGDDALRLEVVDAKVADVPAPDGVSGRLSAIAIFRTRSLPPGLRRLDLRLDPIANPGTPALVRVELEGATLKSIVGGRPARLAEGTGVHVGTRDVVTLMIDVESPAKELRK